MPNHTTNKINIIDGTEEQLRAVASQLLNQKMYVDFDRVIPQPACLKYFSPNMGIVRLAKAKVQAPVSNNLRIAELEIYNRQQALSKEEELSDEDKILVDKAIAAYNQTGFIYWYDWNRTNWGTKWNAYDQPDEGFPSCCAEYLFLTAWSHPFKVIKRLSELCPDVSFFVQYADEDTGSNCGKYFINNGVISAHQYAPPCNDQNAEERKRWREFAFYLVNGEDADPREYDFDENFEYVDID